MPQFQMEISLGGVILIIGQALTFIAFIWKRSAVESEQRGKIEGLISRVTTLETGTNAKFEQVDTETGAKVAALQGAINLMRDQHHELREHLATSYMKREEIQTMERRITDSQTALRADINKLDGKIDIVQKTMLDAVAGVQATVLAALANMRNTPR